jgi:hypothetical protein
LTEVGFKPGKYKLIDVGMMGFTGVVEVVNEAELLDEIHKHLISSWVRVCWKDPAKTEGTIIAGFGRNVGEVKFIE